MSRLRLIVECAATMLLCSSTSSFVFLWLHGFSTKQAGVVLIVPAASTALFGFVSMAIPELYSVGKLRFPITVTLPCVFCSLAVLTMILISRVGISIARVPDALAAINLWANPIVILASVLVGTACLSLLGRMHRER